MRGSSFYAVLVLSGENGELGDWHGFTYPDRDASPPCGVGRIIAGNTPSSGYRTIVRGRTHGCGGYSKTGISVDIMFADIEAGFASNIYLWP